MWWNLTIPERVHYERCITAIVRWYKADRTELYWFMRRADEFNYTAVPIVRAVIWRLSQELDN